jgi:hypothetical protein
VFFLRIAAMQLTLDQLIAKVELQLLMVAQSYVAQLMSTFVMTSV